MPNKIQTVVAAAKGKLGAQKQKAAKLVIAKTLIAAKRGNPTAKKVVKAVAAAARPAAGRGWNVDANGRIKRL